MIDIKLIRENPELVKENIRKKFQDQKLVLVDEVLELDRKNRESKLNGDNLRSERKKLSEQVGNLMRAGQKDEAEKVKAKVQKINEALVENEGLEELLGKKVTFINKTRGEELENAVASMEPQDVVLVQNTRYEDLDGKKESKTRKN